MFVFFVVIIVILLIAIGLLSFALYFFIKKSTFIPDKDKEFIEFTIDMYCDYAKELDIHSPEQHEKIVEQLSRIKNKYFKTNNKKD